MSLASLSSESDTRKGPIAWMVRNPVAANLLMLFLLIGGGLVAMTIKQEVFPEFDLDMISISVPYPGASPEEVEKGVLLALEEEVRGIDGVKEVRATAREGAGSVVIDLLGGADGNKVLQDVKNAVDRITTFPEETERPTVSLLAARSEVMTIAIHGDHQEAVIRGLAAEVRDRLLSDKRITYAELSGVRPLEISVEIPQQTLRAHGLTLGAVAARIRRASVELPGGGVKTASGEILVRVAERRDWGQQFARLPVVTRPDGTTVLLGEIARVTDGFADTDQESFYNGQRAAMIKVYRVGDQTPIAVADAVFEIMKRLKRQQEIPANVSFSVLNDRSNHYRQRMRLLLKNAAMGLALVLLLLGTFLEIRLAFWVTMGIPISFMGAFMILPAADVTINMISMFAFIVSLGIVVDDAIVVGENIYTNRQKGMPFVEAAIRGVREVATPVIFSVLTNIVAFLPMMFVPGFMGKLFRVIPVVVISVFAISLVEALVILPAHLAHARAAKTTGLRGKLHAMQQSVGRALERFIEGTYKPFLMRALRYRYIVLAIAVALLLSTFGYIKGGHIGQRRFPNVEGDEVSADLVMPYGTPIAKTREIERRLLVGAKAVAARYQKKTGKKLLKGIFAQVGSASPRRGPHGGSSATASNLAYLRVYLVPTDQRPEMSARQFEKLWEVEVGETFGVESLRFKSAFGPGGGDALSVRLRHRDMKVLETAAAELAKQFEAFGSKVKDIDDGFAAGKSQFDFKLRPEARSLGLESRDVALQLRSSFYGAEALRQQRGRDEIKVMVRLPESQRCSAYDIEELMLRTPAGGEVPLRDVATIDRGISYTSITRVDGGRTVDVTADVMPKSAAKAILEQLKAKGLPELLSRHPGLSYSLEGDHREMGESFSALGRGLLVALIAIYAMLAIPFRSYVQPLIIMASIPFGILGAVVGHILMGYDLSIMSMMGMVALSGVVVNDSLVLIDFANRARRSGGSALAAISFAGTRRFRAIVLTSLTTFGGLAPMIMETSRQARFMIPMAISLGFGILFATLIALVLVPALYLIVDDLHPPRVPS
jgi:multidrug efflux pump subunit AcrB